MTTTRAEVGGEFLTTALRALESSDGAVALDSLGWWDLLPELDDVDARTAVFALFRAQGRTLASSAALGALLAQPYVEATGGAPGAVVATAVRQSPRQGAVRVVVGDVGGRALLVDRVGYGAAIVDRGKAELHPIDVPGGLVLHEVELDPAEWEASISEADAFVARRRSTYLGRIAASLEILGAAESAVEMSVQYAGDRRQFGSPIGTFQAIRHLLALARTDCVAVEHVVAEAVRLDDAAPPMYGEVVKALAGRNGRRACERALQVLGGIGFTAEHDHHRFHSRVLAMDALLGTSAELTHDLGHRLRTTGADPGFPAAVLRASE